LRADLDGGANPPSSTTNTLENKMDWITADLIDAINETSWFDGIGTILILLATYAAYKWIKKNV
jgi:hypothetical protein|tara:strand:- start:44 stop:235 length:192 start_codon:yes stop_codon:yes gene_type:complete